MKILFVSYLMADQSQGPNFSVPASVAAQSKIDEVFWVDMGHTMMEHWKSVDAYHNVSEFGNFCLEKLPKPFDNPDVVVINGFYRMCFITLANELRKKRIPFIIVPRCSLTKDAHNTKLLKKWIADKIFFESYAHAALCIQYLSQEERDHSSVKWNKRSIVVPNGVKMPKEVKTSFSPKGLNSIFIGRLVADHKGLDILLESISSVKSKLRQLFFHLTLYGEKTRDYNKLKKYVDEHKIEDLVSFGGLISGDDKKKKILEADLHIMTSRFEGLPMAMIETLAYGVPALVTPGTNIQSDVLEYNAGWCCECNVESVSESLLKVIEERSELKKRGKNARQLAEKYSWNDIAVTFHDKVAELLSENRR